MVTVWKNGLIKRKSTNHNLPKTKYIAAVWIFKRICGTNNIE